MTNAGLEKLVSGLLRKTGVSSAPIPIHLVAQRSGLVVQAVAFGDDVSGVLVVQGERGVIGYNSAHPAVRQRFTIAHEVGHYILHRSDSGLFIDQRYFAAFRDKRSSAGVDENEREANSFAAALLMPSQLILREIHKRSFDLGDEEALVDLANEFKVSLQAMVYRLNNLGVLASTFDVTQTLKPAKTRANNHSTAGR